MRKSDEDSKWKKWVEHGRFTVTSKGDEVSINKRDSKEK